MTSSTSVLTTGESSSHGGSVSSGGDPQLVKRRHIVGTWWLQGLVALCMNVLIFLVAAITAVSAGFLSDGSWPQPGTWGAGALKLFTLWCLAFLPGWLYIRFLRMRALAMWNEYVLVLHRLGWDQPWNLPEPPKESDFYADWNRAGIDRDHPRRNIYRQKFEVYYGRSIPERASTCTSSGDDTSVGDFRVRIESLFPVFLATTVFAVGWAATLWDTAFLTAPQSMWDILKYAFMGAYLFVLSMLARRFFQSDLKPSAYATAVLRVIVVLLVVAVLHQMMPITTKVGVEAGLAFVIGFFPLFGLQLIQRIVAKAFGRALPPISSPYPLDQLDGLNLWYEARLVEEGVEDMENLATMNLVDVVLHTRVPPGRLVDWIDQAMLYLRLGPAARADIKPMSDGEVDGWFDGRKAKVRLRRAGIRGATDLLRAFSDWEIARVNGQAPQFRRPPEVEHLPLPQSQLALLVAVLGVEEGLAPVWNWKFNGVRQRNGKTEHPCIDRLTGDPCSN